MLKMTLPPCSFRVTPQPKRSQNIFGATHPHRNKHIVANVGVILIKQMKFALFINSLYWCNTSQQFTQQLQLDVNKTHASHSKHTVIEHTINKNTSIHILI